MISALSSKFYHARAFVLGAIAITFMGLIAYREGLRWYAIWQTEMVSIKGGITIIGTDESEAYEEEKPKWLARVADFQIQKFEVSNRLYRLCVQAGHCEKPVDPSRLFDDKLVNHPVVEVTAFHAANYCDWLMMRLPTELEWERAARGLNGNKWTWGDKTPIAKFANVNSEKTQQPIETIDSYPQGKSQEGVYNLIGNVAEWTASYFQFYKNYNQQLVWKNPKEQLKSEYPLTVRGKSWETSIKRVTERTQTPTSYHGLETGIRCVK
ncbi:SUMF1/EgtB/PvdO family nonheme iron enzyme [Calothrix sp. FACHB-156]|nr:SUMF1/EgtB/PvdO family nonheme iron enzyme [Calothrix sp. FACHB-156]